MARQHGPVCRLCRREGMKLFLKGTRCDTPKCAVERRESPPGMNILPPRQADRLRRAPPREAEGEALLRRAGAAVPQLFAMAERGKGNTGEALMSLLERRLDNIVYRLGFGAVAGPGAAAGPPRPRDGQRPAGGHSQLPGPARRRDPREEPPQEPAIGAGQPGRVPPRRCPTSSAVVEGPQPEGHVLRLPEAADVSIPVQTQLIVELCSK